ncbi:8-oxoguanine DNA glycosylase domain protein [Alkaliphilus metalliredigens QYMF]|uniref:DNA-(apurinic or apyrimidinic site) lyase n=1 Tax=Alkaliphilus metalliredigens (strain QYMF) TaxID=293826 RepID=A6TLI8_ALKMQ|nr:DNA glycosylase [Alkaliphilus metalliredigens]ABR47056.1 8-oxoguanine DNA glycosylase domain protein [Alkaliphilus metalliredigens QYMF]
MNLDIVYEKDHVIIKEIHTFEPKHTFECGQCFRWEREEDGSYTGVVYDKVLNVKKIGNDVILYPTNQLDFENIWIEYFDLHTDYQMIQEHLQAIDPVMKKAIGFGRGIRILRQDPWETIISFIISANNNIPRIKRAIDLMSRGYGQPVEDFRGGANYTFPDAATLSKRTVEELLACNTGYRAPYILKTAQQVSTANIEFQNLKKLDRESCQRQLMTFNGIGPKVANCVLFFSMGKFDAFPVDVWVKRVMEALYFEQKTSHEKIQAFAEKSFGEYAGYAQQYLFYYARELGIGKSKA